MTRVLEAIVAERGQPLADSLRQRARADQSAFSGLVYGAADRVSPHTAGEADAERMHRELSRTAAGRVFECKLVPELVRCAEKDRGMEKDIQRRAATQQSGISNTEGVCRDDGRWSYGKDGSSAALENASGVSHFPTAPAAGQVQQICRIIP